MGWHSLHVHYHDPQDDLLVDCIGPLVASCRTGSPPSWFFLRYWKHGPHVRLRLRLEPAEATETLRALQDGIREHLARCPSTSMPRPDRLRDVIRVLARLQGEADDVQEIVSDNTIRLQPYEPEYGKYGGELGVRLAETVFESSSVIVLDVLDRIRRTPARRLSAGFTMMLAALRGAGLTEPAMAEFLAMYCRFWFRYVSPEVAGAWSAGLIEQQRVLSPYAAAVLSDRLPAGSPAGDALTGWSVAVGAAMERIDAADGDVLAGVTMLGSRSPARRRRDFVLLNYVHTHNNRLGISPAHEAYLAYLAHHVVCQLAAITPQAALVGPMQRL